MTLACQGWTALKRGLHATCDSLLVIAGEPPDEKPKMMPDCHQHCIPQLPHTDPPQLPNDHVFHRERKPVLIDLKAARNGALQHQGSFRVLVARLRCMEARGRGPQPHGPSTIGRQRQVCTSSPGCAMRGAGRARVRMRRPATFQRRR